MQSRKITLSLFVVLVSATTFSAAQIGRDSHSRTLGYYDSATRIFEPLQETMNAEQPAVVVPTTGTLTVKYTITVDATIPKNGVVGCSASAAVTNDSSGSFPSEDGESIGTLVSGKTYSTIRGRLPRHRQTRFKSAEAPAWFTDTRRPLPTAPR
jgi:hypothetical protein